MIFVNIELYCSVDRMYPPIYCIIVEWRRPVFIVRSHVWRSSLWWMNAVKWNKERVGFGVDWVRMRLERFVYDGLFWMLVWLIIFVVLILLLFGFNMFSLCSYYYFPSLYLTISLINLVYTLFIGNILYRENSIQLKFMISKKSTLVYGL